jgi:hypothetical protein
MTQVTDLPSTELTMNFWRVHDSDGTDHGTYDDEQTARAVARKQLEGRTDTGVQVFMTKTTYQSLAFHKGSQT